MKGHIVLKMYILVKASVPSYCVPVICAHASLACYLKYENDSDMQEWSHSTFRKVVVTVNEKEFEKARKVENNLVLTESNLDNMEVAIVLAPREEFPKFIRFLKLYSFGD